MPSRTPDYLGALEAAEADLIDAYVRGELSQAERRAIRTPVPDFAAAPEQSGVCQGAGQGRGRIESGRSVPVKRPSSWQRFLALIRGWDPGVQFAVGVQR